jgi:hypothetical protein
MLHLRWRFCNFITKIEGQNLQYLKYGTANAESTTLSVFGLNQIKQELILFNFRDR